MFASETVEECIDGCGLASDGTLAMGRGVACVGSVLGLVQDLHKQSARVRNGRFARLLAILAYSPRSEDLEGIRDSLPCQAAR